MSVGNLDSQEDWGHAKNYIEMQWMMLQNDKPEDFVIATGHHGNYSARRFYYLPAGVGQRIRNMIQRELFGRVME